jgi:hypothetical protein
MFPDPVAALLARQDGVVSRRQLLAAGARAHDLERWRRRRELSMLHPGVYLAHTGDPTWTQRAWAGVLVCGTAALWGESALRAHEGRHSRSDAGEAALQVAVARARTIQNPPGVSVLRVVRLKERVQWHRRPPCQRYDDAVLEVAMGRRARTDTIAVLAGAVQQRRTTAARLIDTLDTRPRAHDRAWVRAVLSDLAEGTSSVLEHTYLQEVERAHDLPASQRQQRAAASSGVVYRDHEYDEGLVVELDGRLFHESAEQRDRDLERDLDAALDGLDTRRLGWGQVVGRPCITAGKLARLLVRRGWPGHPRACGPDCLALAAFDGAGEGSAD